MQRHHVPAAIAAAAVGLLVSLLLIWPQAAWRPLAITAHPLESLPSAEPAQHTDADSLQGCVQTGECAIIAGLQLGGYTVDVLQDTRVPNLPAVHFVTRYADAQPRVWTLRDEHGGTLTGITCSETSCIAQLAVTGELTVMLDVRVRDGMVQGLVDGAGMTHSPVVQMVDLDRDGFLDVIVTEKTYSDAVAQVYYRTLRNDDGMLVTSGCSAATEFAADPPRSLLSGPCPTQ